MDVQCKGLEKDWSITVGSDRIEVIERSGGMGTTWSLLGDQGAWEAVCVNKKGKYHINYSLNTTVSHTTPL